MQTRERRGYTGAEVRTNDFFTYGRFVVRMKAARPSGVVSSFFTFHSPDSAIWNEIDIEFLGGKWGRVQFNAITPGKVSHEMTCELHFDAADQIHTYAFDWTPSSIIWYVDGREMYRDESEYIRSLNKPQQVMMNVWNSSDPSWTGYMNSCHWDQRVDTYKVVYDEVAIYRYDSASNSITHDRIFFEDFSNTDTFSEQWDIDRTHTFDGNMAFFNPRNSSIQTNRSEHVLELKLTRNPEMLTELTDEMYAFIITYGEYSGVRDFLRQGANPNHHDRHDGSTALHLAVWRNHRHLIDLLLEYGANPFLDKDNGQTAYAVAEAMRHREISERLYTARQNKLTELIAHGPGGVPNVEEVWNHLRYDSIDPNIQDTYSGSTPLHVAASLGNTKVADILLHGFRCDVSRRKTNGQTALAVAEECGSQEVAEMIRAR